MAPASRANSKIWQGVGDKAGATLRVGAQAVVDGPGDDPVRPADVYQHAGEAGPSQALAIVPAQNRCLSWMTGIRLTSPPLVARN